ncbi:hypothetical protein M9458_021362, partial [Cirrhinus mrigala]
RRASAALGLHSSSCASSFHPSGSVRLLFSSSFNLVLCRSGSIKAFRMSASASPEPSAPPWPSRSSASPWLIGSL